MRPAQHLPLFTHLLLVILLAFYPATGSFGQSYIETPCEIEWRNIEFAQALPAERISHQQGWAERGNADAQYFMGLASQDSEERAMWLKKAIANGSKGAAAYYAYFLDERWKTELINPNNPDAGRKSPSRELVIELMQPVIEAAEAGDPQAATWLMQMGRMRWNYKKDGPHPILKSTDIPKWAEIAARGGNPAAAELLCGAHYVNYRGLDGLEKDETKGFYWCSIAAVRACSSSAKNILAEHYKHGRGTAPSLALSKYWARRSDLASKRIQIELLDRPLVPKNSK